MVNIILKGQPISTNNCYYHAGRGVTFIKPKAKKLKDDYIKQIKQQWKKKPLENMLELGIKLYFNDKRKRDWDNYHKLSQDALNRIVWLDDVQILKATVEKFYDKQNPRIELEITNTK
jgi:crossover junction endodeoxyribonuclease RusA